MMVYVALLRGVNVGGKAMISMKDLKLSFEELGLEEVTTYINSGNVIFRTSEPRRRLPARLEAHIQTTFGLKIRVLLRSLPEMEALVASIPSDWVHTAEQKSDVMFLQPEVDEPAVINQLSWNPSYESLRYLPGALIWHTNMTYARTSKVLKVNQMELYQHMTIRNPNTVRKLLERMQTV